MHRTSKPEKTNFIYRGKVFYNATLTARQKLLEKLKSGHYFSRDSINTSLSSINTNKPGGVHEVKNYEITTVIVAADNIVFLKTFYRYHAVS